MIIASKDCLLVSSYQNKEFFLFDPKTTAVLQKYRDQTYVSSFAYYQFSQQILAQQKNKTFVSVWNSDSLEVQLKVSLNESMSCLRVTENNHYLMGGSTNGNLYFWELPGGILLKKHSIHSQQIKQIIEYKNNYLITASLTEVKLWPLSNILLETDNSVAKKTYQSINQIISTAHTRNILALLTHKSLTFLQVSLESSAKEFQFIYKMDFQYATTLCVSHTLAFVGDAKGNVDVIPLFPGEEEKNELAFRLKEGTKQLQISRPKVKKVLNSGGKHPVSALSYVQSLNYLIVGYVSGQVAVFSNYELKKTLHLFKTPINEIQVIKKPSQIKIYQSQKMCPLNKYELGKEQELLQIIPQSYAQDNDYQTDLSRGFSTNTEQNILSKMLKTINQPERVMKQEIQLLKTQRRLLLESNLHYFKLLSQ